MQKKIVGFLLENKFKRKEKKIFKIKRKNVYSMIKDLKLKLILRDDQIKKY